MLELGTGGGAFMNYYTDVILISWLSLGVLCILVAENDRFSKEEKRLFYLSYALTAAAALAEWLGVWLNGNTGLPTALLRAVKCADYILTPATGAAVALQLRHRSIWQKFLLGLTAFNAGFQIVAAFTGQMLIIDSQNRYYHGQIYGAYVLMYVLVIVLFAAQLISYGQSFRRQNRTSLYATMFLVLIGIAIQEFTGGEIRTSYLAITIGMAMMYIHNTEFSQLAADDKLREQKIQILLAQIQPHFLYNSLSAIKAACYVDPEKAMDAIDRFAEYLRHNMDSIAEDEPIPFAKELRHVEHYLELQRLRFGDELKVEYDIECTDFRLPTLTLQPLVENAVTYGVRKQRERQGLVVIRSREYQDRYEVSVVDNGPGFVPDTLPGDSKRSHVGLRNVRERLARVCGGELRIDSVLGEGTDATIILPKTSAKMQAEQAEEE